MEVELIDKMGSDLSVVNAARVSFNKRKFAWEEKDEKLIKYLAELKTSLSLEVETQYSQELKTYL